MKEYLATLDNTAWGAASDVVPKFVSPSDPRAYKGPAVLLSPTIISSTLSFVDDEASRSIRQAEVGAAKTNRANGRALRSQRVFLLLKKLLARGYRPNIPNSRKLTQRPGSIGNT